MLKSELTESVKRHHSSTLLLSGGLDSSILAEIARPSQTVTVVWDDNSPDLRYARRIALMQRTKHTEVNLNRKGYLSKVLRTVIGSLKTFSPIEVRNSVVSCAGLMVAKQLGYEDVMTGDGCDELFVGYKYLGKYFQDLDRLNYELNRLWNIMRFSSNVLSKTIGIGLMTPFLDTQFLSYATSVPLSKKIGKYSGNFWGKYILRKCFQSELGYDFAWRNKMAQEEGAGTVNLKNHFENDYDERTFVIKIRSALNERVNISSKEQLHYYEIFRSYYCPPANEECLDSRCPKCCGCVSAHDTYCKICGSFPINPITLPHD
jgi:asparagine synthase (glutamine-hydrolysing)